MSLFTKLPAKSLVTDAVRPERKLSDLMRSSVLRSAKRVESNPKQTAEQLAWNAKVEAARTAKKGHRD